MNGKIGRSKATTIGRRRSLAVAVVVTFFCTGLGPVPGAGTRKADQTHNSRAPLPQRPNIVVFMLDDVGFSHMRPFGGAIDTPNIERVAQQGLRYTNFHTQALCSPTRAAFLSGRNHHSMGTGVITELQTSDPGYTGILPKDKALFVQSLKDFGYATMGVGKWHNTPVHEVTTTGPYDLWPTSLGFEHYYGFLGADTDQFHPVLWDDRAPVDPSVGHPEYHLTVDLTDRSIQWLEQQNRQNPKKPFFLYYATGAAHAPHQAPPEFIAKYSGKFDQGWDKVREETLARQKVLGIFPQTTELSPRPEPIPAWDSLSLDQKRVYARLQEVFAGFVEHTDHEFGRLLDTIAQMGKLDNTIIIITSDNGASGEGGLDGSANEMRVFNGFHDNLADLVAGIDQFGSEQTYNHYPAGWALAGNTPLRFWKQINHEGGIRDPFIISWPNFIMDKGAVRSQFTDSIDVAPTLFELTGIQPAAVINGIEQKPIEGVSFVASLNDQGAKTTKTVQYFEMLGNRGIWADGWKAVAFHGRYPWTTGISNPNFDDDRWELYKADEDPSEVHDLAAKYPSKLAELKSLWNQQALLYNVYPLNDSTAQRIAATYASFTAGRTEFTYHEGDIRIPEPLSPPVKNRSHTITATVDIPPAGAEGMLVTCGGRFAGYALYIQGGHLHYVHNYLNEARYDIASNGTLPTGRVELAFQFDSTGNGHGIGKLFVNGEKVGEGAIDQVVPGVYSANETFDVGLDTGTPVIDTYSVPFPFTGKIVSVVFRLADAASTIYEAPLADPFDE